MKELAHDERFAIYRVSKTDIWRGARVHELLPNKRCSLESELKNKTVVYYDKLCSINEGEDLLDEYDLLVVQCRKEQQEIYDKYLKQIQELFDEEVHSDRVLPVHENVHGK